MAVHASPSLLKQRVGGSKIYIRPLQRDLDITSVKDEADLVKPEVPIYNFNECSYNVILLSYLAT